MGHTMRIHHWLQRTAVASLAFAATACAGLAPITVPSSSTSAMGFPETIRGEPRGVAYEPADPEGATPGTTVRRFLEVPEGEAVSDAERFPVGTRAWQEISVNGRRVETRLVERTGDGARSWSFASWVWNQEGTVAELAPLAGLRNVAGTGHDVPAAGACLHCHAKGGQYLLGVHASKRSDEAGLLAVLPKSGPSAAR